MTHALYGAFREFLEEKGDLNLQGLQHRSLLGFH